MINKGGKLLETKVDIVETMYKINNNNLIRVLKSIYRKIEIEKRLLTLIKKTPIEDNLQVYVLYNIIKIQLLFNYL